MLLNAASVPGKGLDAIVVLGCRLRWEGGRLAGAGGRRVLQAARVASDAALRATPLIASGGRAWGGVLEADAFADELVRVGVAASRIERERLSRSTRENARFVTGFVGEGARVVVVTCDWHLPRATKLFRMAGLEVEGVGAASPGTWTQRAWRWCHEEAASRLDGV